jgi:hypothetical protein
MGRLVLSRDEQETYTDVGDWHIAHFPGEVW